MSFLASSPPLPELASETGVGKGGCPPVRSSFPSTQTILEAPNSRYVIWPKREAENPLANLKLAR
jgi:hypothetical protein